MTFPDSPRGGRKINVSACVWDKKRFHQSQPNCCNSSRVCLYWLLPFLVFTSVIFHISFLVRLSSMSFFVSNLLPLLLLLSTPITPTLFYTSKLLEGMWSVWWVSGAYSSPAASFLSLLEVCVRVFDGVQIQYKVKILWCLSKAHLTVTILGALNNRRQEHSFANTCTCVWQIMWSLGVSGFCSYQLIWFLNPHPKWPTSLWERKPLKHNASEWIKTKFNGKRVTQTVQKSQMSCLC